MTARHRKASLTPEAYQALRDSAYEASSREKRHVSLSERLLGALAIETAADMIRELHWDKDGHSRCVGCGHAWPCATIRVLDGADTDEDAR